MPKYVYIWKVAIEAASVHIVMQLFEGDNEKKGRTLNMNSSERRERFVQHGGIRTNDKCKSRYLYSVSNWKSWSYDEHYSSFQCSWWDSALYGIRKHPCFCYRTTTMLYVVRMSSLSLWTTQ